MVSFADVQYLLYSEWMGWWADVFHFRIDTNFHFSVIKISFLLTKKNKMIYLAIAKVEG